jgi:hypothetical protein
MRKISARGEAKLNERILSMLNLHARAYHLPHVRRYHAERRRRQRSYDKAKPQFGKPVSRLTVPLHYGSVTELNSRRMKNEFEVGWTEFLHWKHGLVAVVDIRKDFIVSSLVTGPPAMTQWRIAQRIPDCVVRRKDFHLIAVPALHFRAFTYVERKKKTKRILIPLQSSIVALQLGKKYSAGSVGNRLEKALEHRIQSALEGSQRRDVRKGILGGDAPNGGTI